MLTRTFVGKSSRRHLICLFMTLCFIQPYLSHCQIYGDFPYFQTFTSGAKPAEVTLVTPQGAGTNSTIFTTTGMQLTPANTSSFGAVFVNDRQFSSLNGINIEFEYGMYGGTGADGISFFLFDAAIASPVIGFSGAGLGYAYNRANNLHPSVRATGLTGGYLGIGLDAFGNYKSRRFQGDARINGVPPPTGGWSQSANHVTIRGAKGNTLDAGGRGDGYTGYPVLVTRSTQAGANAAAEINPATGAYTYAAGSPDNFTLGTGSFSAVPGDPNYRKAFISLIPNIGGGFNITVKIQHGVTSSTVIDNYWYQTLYTYQENANGTSGSSCSAGSTPSDLNNCETLNTASNHSLITAVPASFRIGFGAATGGSTNIHLIRNLKVMLPYAALAAPDEVEVCAGQTASSAVLNNDIAYSGLIAAGPTASASSIDKTSFRFVDANGASLGQNYTQTGVGTWVYNSASGIVTFNAIAGYTGTAAIKYNIKGSSLPFSDEGYRSEPASITVTVKPQPDAGADKTALCVSANSINMGATALSGAAWSLVSGPGSLTIGNSSMATSSVSNFSSAGIYTLGWTLNGCTDNAVITVAAPDFGNLPVTGSPAWPAAYATILPSGTRVWLGDNSSTPSAECATNISDDKNGGLSFGYANINPGVPRNCTVTLNSNVSGTTCYYGLWIDWNNNGSFADAIDQFYSGNAVAASPVSATFPVTPPAGASANYKMRLAASASPVVQAMFNGGIINGEIEDYSTPVLLPLHLIRFTAVAVQGGVLTYWLTADQPGSGTRFIPEYSTDGRQWQPLQQVAASALREYRYLHTINLQGDLFYRLRIVEPTGTEQISAVEVVHMGKIQQITLLPNPAKNRFWVQGIYEQVTVQLIDATGRVCRQQTAVAGLVMIDTGGIPAGVYQVLISNKQKQITIQKIVLD